MENVKCGYVFKPLTEEEHEFVKKYHTTYDKDENPHVRVGQAGYILLKHFLTHADGIRNLQLRPDDVFVVTYPRSGTTLTQELVWLINNNLDFEKAKSKQLTANSGRYQFLEFYMTFTPASYELFKQDERARHTWEDSTKPAAETLNAMKSQRFIKTHLPLSLLPTNTLDTAKVVYVARDVRDVAVSYYQFYKALPFGIRCNFKEYYQNMFSKNMVHWSPYFEHIKEAWALRDHPNMLYIFYEELTKDMKSVAKRVADFFGKTFTDEQFDKLCNHLAIDNFKKNKSVNFDEFEHAGFIGDKSAFIRRGKSSGWRESFDPEMTQHAARWMQEELQGTGIHFHI